MQNRAQKGLVMSSQGRSIAQEAYERGRSSYQESQRFYYQFLRMGQQKHLKDAVNHYERALVAINQTTDAELWAKLQHALGNAYRDLSNQNYEANLREAAEHYQQALQVISYSKWSEAQSDWVISSGKLSKLLEEQVKTLHSSSLPRAFRVMNWAQQVFLLVFHATNRTQRVLLIVLLILLIPVLIFSTILSPLRIAANYGITIAGFVCIPGHLSINGSTALRPLIRLAAISYEQKCPGASIDVNKPDPSSQGSLNGLNQVNQKQVDIGTSDVFADSALSNLKDHQVAVVIFTLVVNYSVTNIPGLSTDQIRRIYSNAFNQSNDILQWHDVDARGPQNLDVVRTSRPSSSGTRATFETYVLGTTEGVSGPNGPTDTTSAVAYIVQTTPGAIGYVSLCYAKMLPACKLDREKAYQEGEIPNLDQSANTLILLQINQQDANPLAVENNSYKFWNIEHMYTRAERKQPTCERFHQLHAQ